MRRRWEAAVGARERAIDRAERALLRATGGLSLHRFEQVCRRSRIRTVADAVQVATAVRARSRVEAAQAELDRTRAAHDAAVLAARTALAEVAAELNALGHLGETLAGVGSEELRRLARRPRARSKRSSASSR